MINSEEYVVKFRKKNAEGFVETLTESVMFASKGKHRKAEEFIRRKYRKSPFFTTVEIVSVVYQ